MKNWLKKQVKEFSVLLRSVPGWLTTMFVVSVVAMNLCANKSVAFSTEWLALDVGIIFSWMSFLSMDLIVKQFGAKASVKMTIVTILFNVIISAMFFLGSLIPGTWGVAYDSTDMLAVNNALDSTIAGNWYIVFGSTVAFITASIFNALINEGIGKRLKKDNYFVFALRTYVSTFFGQFVDNFVFAFIVSQVLFGWTLIQCVVCAATGAFCELLFEVVFSPIGWKVCKKWKEQGIGKEYIDLVK